MKNEKSSVVMKGKVRDLFKFINMANLRKKIIKNTSKTPQVTLPEINLLAQALHPVRQEFIIYDIINETKTTKSYILKPRIKPNPAYFQAGQFLSVCVSIDRYEIARPFSLASAPYESLEGFYKLTIKKKQEGYVSQHILDNWEKGTIIRTSGPLGNFYYDPIRDKKSIIAIAGGSGITPIMSVLKQIIHESSKDSLMKTFENCTLTLFYGCSDDDELLYYQEFRDIASNYPDIFKFHMVMSCEDTAVENTEMGFITKEIIQKYVPDVENHSFFICGPSLMYDFIWNELSELGIHQKCIRSECYGDIERPERFPSFPSEAKKTFTITVHTNTGVNLIQAKGNESILVSLEKSKLDIPNGCRSGECAYCRSKLIKGEIWVSPHSDGRRIADEMFNMFHPCASFPLSDIEMILPKKN